MKRQTYLFFALLFLAITAVIILSVRDNSQNNLYTPNKLLYNYSINNSASIPTKINTDKNGVLLSQNNTSSSNETIIGFSPAPSQKPIKTTTPQTGISYKNTSNMRKDYTNKNSISYNTSLVTDETLCDITTVTPKAQKVLTVSTSPSPTRVYEKSTAIIPVATVSVSPTASYIYCSKEPSSQNDNSCPNQTQTVTATAANTVMPSSNVSKQTTTGITNYTTATKEVTNIYNTDININDTTSKNYTKKSQTNSSNTKKSSLSSKNTTIKNQTNSSSITKKSSSSSKSTTIKSQTNSSSYTKKSSLSSKSTTIKSQTNSSSITKKSQTSSSSYTKKSSSSSKSTSKGSQTQKKNAERNYISKHNKHKK